MFVLLNKMCNCITFFFIPMARGNKKANIPHFIDSFVDDEISNWIFDDIINKPKAESFNLITE